MSILDNEGHDPNGLGNRPTWDNRPGINGVLERKDAEIARLRATIRCCIVAMRSAQQSKVHTDWTQMIAGLEGTVPEQKEGS